jgi:phage terminase large subunit-like protein
VPRRAAKPPADSTTQYALDVVEGRIVSGKLAIAAAQRHLDDLEHAPKRGFTWHPELAERPLAFLPTILTITGGAMAGQPFTPLPWHVFVTGSLYGWRRANGQRRFKRIWLETGRGSAKGPVAAAIALYDTFFAGVQRAEAYCIGETMVTSNALFADAVAMCRGTIPGSEPGDTLEKRQILFLRGVGELTWQIERRDTQSKMQALAIGDAMSGPKPTMVLVDEVHEIKSGHAIQQWASALGKQPRDGLMILCTNTPASNQVVGTEYSEIFQSIAKQEIINDSSFAYIARTDPTDDPFNDESCWIKALPALGVTYDADNVRDEIANSRHMPAARLSVSRLYFGIPVGSEGFWIDEDAWNATQQPIDDDELRQYPCYLGLDLSQKNDLTALARVWKLPDGQLHAKLTYWKPKETFAAAEIEDKAPYSAWAEDKLLIGTPGKTINFEFVADEVRRTCDKFNVPLCAFDPAFFTDFLDAADHIGFACYEYHPDKPPGRGVRMMRHAQGSRGLHTDKTLWMPRSFRAMCDAILQDRLKIDPSPVTTYCASNVALGTDAMGNQWIEKKKNRSHNDGIVALCMAIGAATHQVTEAPKRQSIWDREDFLAVLA